jgi:hypothetical protein
MIGSGDARNGRVCTSTLYTRASAKEKACDDGTAHLHEGQAATVIPEGAPPPTPDAGRDDDSMLRELDRIGASLRRYLARTGR